MKSEEYSEPFASIAPYYDTLMSYINYPSWVSYIKSLLVFHSIEQRTIFDIACGTGVCLELWSQGGYEVIGLDRSLEMLKVCQQRFSNIGRGSVRLINGDMRTFALGRAVPVITCLYDSLNYLLSEDDLLACFRRVYEALERGGVFVFDMNTIYCLRTEWGDSTFFRQDKNIDSVWNNTFDPATAISSLTIALRISENGTVKTITERHQERGYALSTISELLQQVGFHAQLYRHLTFTPALETNLRISGTGVKC